MFQFVGPAEKLAGGVKSNDRTRAILEGLATADDPVDDHEDIVGRIAFTDDGAVASISDRSTPNRKYGAFRHFLPVLEDKRTWRARPRTGHHFVKQTIPLGLFRRIFDLKLTHRNSPEIEAS